MVIEMPIYTKAGMPIYTKAGLPVNGILRKEKIQILEELENANSIDKNDKILEVAILNLMPLKEDTELQLLRKLSTSGKSIKITFVKVSSYISKTTAPEHMQRFYSTFEEIKNKYFDGLIITGAPVEQMEFEEVDYWKELEKIMEWSETHAKSTLHICWGAQAGLYYHYGIDKHLIPNKMFGVFEHKIDDKNSKILSGFEEGFKAPHSRHTTVYKEDIEKVPELEVVSESEKAGVFIVENREKRQLFVTGHLEYAVDTLDKEYKRDLSKGLKIDMPENYYQDNNPEENPVFSWKENGDKIYSNWVNYYL